MIDENFKYNGARIKRITEIIRKPVITNLKDF